MEGHGRMRVTAVGDATENGKVFEADLDGQNQLPADVETFILTVLKDYAYLL